MSVPRRVRVLAMIALLALSIVEFTVVPVEGQGTPLLVKTHFGSTWSFYADHARVESSSGWLEIWWYINGSSGSLVNVWEVENTVYILLNVTVGGISFKVTNSFKFFQVPVVEVGSVIESPVQPPAGTTFQYNMVASTAPALAGVGGYVYNAGGFSVNVTSIISTVSGAQVGVTSNNLTVTVPVSAVTLTLKSVLGYLGSTFTTQVLAFNGTDYAPGPAANVSCTARNTTDATISYVVVPAGYAGSVVAVPVPTGYRLASTNVTYTEKPWNTTHYIIEFTMPESPVSLNFTGWHPVFVEPLPAYNPPGSYTIRARLAGPDGSPVSGVNITISLTYAGATATYNATTGTDGWANVTVNLGVESEAVIQATYSDGSIAGAHVRGFKISNVNVTTSWETPDVVTLDPGSVFNAKLAVVAVYTIDGSPAPYRVLYLYNGTYSSPPANAVGPWPVTATVDLGAWGTRTLQKTFQLNLNLGGVQIYTSDPRVIENPVFERRILGFRASFTVYSTNVTMYFPYRLDPGGLEVRVDGIPVRYSLSADGRTLTFSVYSSLVEVWYTTSNVAEPPVIPTAVPVLPRPSMYGTGILAVALFTVAFAGLSRIMGLGQTLTLASAITLVIVAVLYPNETELIGTFTILTILGLALWRGLRR